MNKNKAIEITKDLFEHYPSIDTFHVTADGQAFTQKDYAENHANSLDKKDPIVITVDRADEPVKEVAKKVVTAAAEGAPVKEVVPALAKKRPAAKK